MLKNKITKITLVLLLALSLLVPIVRADDNEAEPISDSSQEKAVETTQGNETTSETTQSTDNSMKKSDVYLTGDDVKVDYIVDGNLFILANTVTISSQIGGDAFICAKTINVEKEGYIYSNLFAAANEVNISGVVYDLYTTANTLNINGYVYRDIRTSSDTLNFSGVIGRNAYVSSKNIEISSNSDGQSSVTNKATIYGDLNYSSSSEVSIPEGTVTGSVNYSPITTSTKSKSISSYILALGRFIVTVLVIWLLYLWLAPKFLENTGALLSKKLLPVIGSGILTPIIFVIAFVLLLILGLTSNIAIIGTMLFAVLLMISNSTFVIAINNLVCKKFNISKNTTTFGVLIITSAVIWLLELIPVVGSILNFVIMIIGLGILVTAIIPEKEKSNKNSKKEEIKK
jgi:membrane protein